MPYGTPDAFDVSERGIFRRGRDDARQPIYTLHPRTQASLTFIRPDPQLLSRPASLIALTDDRSTERFELQPLVPSFPYSSALPSDHRMLVATAWAAPPLASKFMRGGISCTSGTMGAGIPAFEGARG